MPSLALGNLCTQFDPLDGAFSSNNFDTTTLCTPAPTNYRSHWTGVEEARQVLKDLDLEEIVVEERGKGVLVAARAKARQD